MALLLLFAHSVFGCFGRPKASYAMSDSGNMRLGDAKSDSKGGLRFLASVNIRNLFVRQPSIPMLKSEVMSALDACVPIVVAYRSKSQMLGIDADRVVAFVHDDHALWNWPNKQFVNVSMSLRAVPISPASATDDAIPPRTFVSSPKPASWGFLYSGFKRYAGNNMLVLVERAFSALCHIAELTQVAAKCLSVAKQAFLFTLFHGPSRSNGQVMTLP